MAKFSFNEWYKNRCKNHVTNVRIPLPGEEKPAQLRLAGHCDASVDALVKLAKKQEGNIPCKLPNKETQEGVGLRGRAECDAAAFEELLRGIAQAAKEGDESASPKKEESKEPASRGNGQPASAPASK